MTRPTLYGQLEQIFVDRIPKSKPDGRWGSHEVRVVFLADGNNLRAAMDEETTYWLEVVFGDDGSIIRLEPGTRPSPGNAQILTDVVRENQRR